MAVLFDSKPTAYNSADGFSQEVIGATSISAASGMTIGSGANFLTGMMTFGSTGTPPTLPSMTWDGVSMTLQHNVSSGTGPSATSVMCTLALPNVGTKTLAGAWTGAKDCYMSCISSINADIQTIDNISNTNQTSLDIVATSNGMTIANFAVDGATPTISQTKIWAESPNSPGGGGSYAMGGLITTNHAFTGAGGTVQVITGLHLISTSVDIPSFLLPKMPRIKFIG